jgi:hypothetical protein
MPVKAKPPLTTPDGEVREITPEDFAHFRPTAEIVPEIVKRARRHRGAQKTPDEKNR